MNDNLSNCDISLQGNEFPDGIAAENLNSTENENSGSELLIKELIETAKMDTPVKKKRIQKSHFECEICQKMFYSKRHVEDHIKTHTGEKPHTCDKCNKSFSQQSNFKRHLLVHTGERRFSCHICPKKFTYKEHYMAHVCIHTGERPHVCETCGRGFTRKQYMKAHMMTHSAVKPFACKVCGNTFRLSSSLSSHMLTHSEVPSYVCYICKISFKTKKGLKNHDISFSSFHDLKKSLGYDSSEENGKYVTDHEMSYKCSECQKDFSCERDLQKHIQSHKLSKQFICDQCEKEFPKPSLLIRHMHSHAGEKLLTQSCDSQSNIKSQKSDICEKKIKAKKSLNSHLKTHKQVKSNEGPSSGLIKSKTNHNSVLLTEKFSDTAVLNTNTETFAKKENFQCNVCQKMFAQQYLLNIHLFVHHAPRKESGPIKVLVVKYS